MVILVCKSESGDDYIFKCETIPSEEEFNKFIKETYPDEYMEEFNKSFIEIEYKIQLDDIKEIKL